MKSKTFPINQEMCLLLLASAVCFQSPAYAQTGVWMLLGDGDKLESGIKPDRVMHYANSAHIRDRTDQNAKITEIMKNPDPKTIDARVKAIEVNEMDVIEVYENPKAPGVRKLTMLFHCGKKQFRVTQAETIERNNLNRLSGGTEWEAYNPTSWQSRAHFVACFPEVWVPIVKADQEELRRTKAAPKQAALRTYGVAMVGNWSNHDGLMQAYRFTWDKLWAGNATPAPFHSNRTPAEEAEYQAWKQKNDAALAENARAAPMVGRMVAGLEGNVKGQLKGMDEERAFQEEIAQNFKKHKSDYYTAFKGLTEEALVSVRGAPTSASNHGTLRLLAYSYATDNSRTVVTATDSKGAVTGTAVDRQTLYCDVTFHLRVGGNQPQHRVVDYTVKVDMTNQGGFVAASCQ